VADPATVADPGYATGLRAAVSAAVSYVLDALAEGVERLAPLPAELLAQARAAARNGVPLDTVLRRYIAGHRLLDEFILAEAADAGELREALRTSALVLEHLVDAVAAEYRGELELRLRSRENRRAECARRLLSGELMDAAELGYELDAWHLGAVAKGAGAREALRSLAAEADARLLAVDGDEGAVWAWLGAGRPLDPAGLDAEVRGEPNVALGEPGYGIEGWRLTHRQAAAALPLLLRSSRLRGRYVDLALLAAVAKDDVLIASLHELYLRPLAEERDGGATLRLTLRSYFAAERNVSSTAVALGVSRKTVTARLRAVERRLGRIAGPRASALEVALALEEVSISAVPRVLPAGR